LSATFVRAVRGAEGVVYVNIAARGKFACEERVVGFFFGMKAHVLEHDDFAGCKRVARIDAGLADTVGHEAHRYAESFAQALGNGRKRERGNDRSVGSSQVREDDHARAALE